MPLRFIETNFPGLYLVETQEFPDSRGIFMELYRLDSFKDKGISLTFLQDNCSISKKNVIRGLHYQLRSPQAKLVCCLKGIIWDVALDIRLGSPTFGRFFSCSLGDGFTRMVYIPEGMAHGFCVVSEEALVMYKCSSLYDPQDEYGVFFGDKDLSIPWPVENPIVSEKDQKLPNLKDLNYDLLPKYNGLVYGRGS